MAVHARGGGIRAGAPGRGKRLNGGDRPRGGDPGRRSGAGSVQFLTETDQGHNSQFFDRN